MQEVLFKTLHGSRLYGFAKEGSDYDYYTVVTKKPHRRGSRARYAKQSVIGDQDSFVVDLGTWMEMCKTGVPQALEAMFSPIPEIDKLGAFRQSFRAGSNVASRYLRTIKSFAYQDTFKHKRHALRLAVNLNSILKTGRFNPQIERWDRFEIECLAELLDANQAHEAALDIVWS